MLMWARLWADQVSSLSSVFLSRAAGRLTVSTTPAGLQKVLTPR